MIWPIHSPASGPTATAPTTTFRSGSAKSLRKPGRFGSWNVDVREILSTPHLPTTAPSPLVSPTLATCGSVKTAAGMAL